MFFIDYEGNNREIMRKKIGDSRYAKAAYIDYEIKKSFSQIVLLFGKHYTVCTLVREIQLNLVLAIAIRNIEILTFELS